MVPEAEALAAIRSGEAVARDPGGRLVRFVESVYAHWADKPAERARRMHRIRQAYATVQEPQEVWERNGRRYYFKTFEDRGRAHGMMVIADDQDNVQTWIPSARIRQRTGTLLHTEDA